MSAPSAIPITFFGGSIQLLSEPKIGPKLDERNREAYLAWVSDVVEKVEKEVAKHKGAADCEKLRVRIIREVRDYQINIQTFFFRDRVAPQDLPEVLGLLPEYRGGAEWGKRKEIFEAAWRDHEISSLSLSPHNPYKDQTFHLVRGELDDGQSVGPSFISPSRYYVPNPAEGRPEPRYSLEIAIDRGEAIIVSSKPDTPTANEVDRQMINTAAMIFRALREDHETDAVAFSTRNNRLYLTITPEIKKKGGGVRTPLCLLDRSPFLDGPSSEPAPSPAENKTPSPGKCPSRLLESSTSKQKQLSGHFKKVPKKHRRIASWSDTQSFNHKKNPSEFLPKGRRFSIHSESIS